MSLTARILVLLAAATVMSAAIAWAARPWYQQPKPAVDSAVPFVGRGDVLVSMNVSDFDGATVLDNAVVANSVFVRLTRQPRAVWIRRADVEVVDRALREGHMPGLAHGETPRGDLFANIKPTKPPGPPVPKFFDWWFSLSDNERTGYAIAMDKLPPGRLATVILDMISEVGAQRASVAKGYEWDAEAIVHSFEVKLEVWLKREFPTPPAAFVPPGEKP